MRPEELVEEMNRSFMGWTFQQVFRLLPQERVQRVRAQLISRTVLTNQKSGVKAIPEMRGIGIVRG
jgi:hypothetical protein